MENNLEEEDDYIYKINNEFPFSNMHIENPEPLSNGIYFIKMCIQKSPIYIQLPKCNIKNDSYNTKNNNCDLIYLYKNNIELIEWIEKIEKSCKNMINNNKKLLFKNDLSEHDIDNMMTPFYRLYNSGTNLLIKTNIDINNQKSKCLIYDDNENDIEISDLNINNDVIPLIHIKGILISSKSFQLDIEIIQLMIINNEMKEDNFSYLGKDNEINNTALNDEENYVKNIKEKEEIIEVSLDDLEIINNNEIIELNKPNDIYYKKYKEARKKALEIRNKSIEAFLEAKQIKTKYMLQNLDDSDSSNNSDDFNSFYNY